MKDATIKVSLEKKDRTDVVNTVASPSWPTPAEYS